MVHIVTPKVYLLAATTMNVDLGGKGYYDFLKEIGAEDWDTDAANDASELLEVAGRFCYKSFGTGLNPNVTKVREGNEAYLANVAKSKHGSVYEHASVTFALVDVSPVVTHELVRHRAGTAFSQVSMRFVRLDKIGVYYPEAFEESYLMGLAKHLSDAGLIGGDVSEWAAARAEEIHKQFMVVVAEAERFQKTVAASLMLDAVDEKGNGVVPFAIKKRITSSMRRAAPYGLATGIILTANHRAWRHMIETRTSRHAEEEIRRVFGEIAAHLSVNFPAIYQDMKSEKVDGMNEYTFEHSKI